MPTFFCYLSFENGLLVTVDPRGDMYLPNQDYQKYLPVSLLFTSTLSFLCGRISIARLTINGNGREVPRLTSTFFCVSLIWEWLYGYSRTLEGTCSSPIKTGRNIYLSKSPLTLNLHCSAHTKQYWKRSGKAYCICSSSDFLSSDNSCMITVDPQATCTSTSPTNMIRNIYLFPSPLPLSFLSAKSLLLSSH